VEWEEVKRKESARIFSQVHQDLFVIMLDEVRVVGTGLSKFLD